MILSEQISPAQRMTGFERRASAALASIFALRMLGLFLVLPVFALEAARYPGGDNPVLVGLAMGVYGLTQALLQIPLGVASDRWGRKLVIQGGLAIFALGSLVAAWAPTLEWLTVGRALQGAGAISAAVTAFIADVTRDEVRTKAMAMVGISIALMFAASLVLAPVLTDSLGFGGLFVITCGLALTGMAVVAWVVPDEPVVVRAQGRSAGLAEVLRHGDLLRLNFGVFVLHAVQLAMWLALPQLLVQAGLVQAGHWKVYLVTLLAAFLVMGGGLFRLERRGYMRMVLLSSIGMLLAVQLLLWWSSFAAQPSLVVLVLALFLFFLGFVTLEASQPSLVSRLAEQRYRGAALGVYNTAQSLGFFIGGAAGGWLVAQLGASSLFLACAALMLLWQALAWSMRAPPRPGVRPAAK